MQKFQDIFDVSVVQEKSTELSSVDSLAIESNAITIIRLCEELLNISRRLKETWCLESIKVTSEASLSEKDTTRDIYEKFNQLTDILAGHENLNVANLAKNEIAE